MSVYTITLLSHYQFRWQLICGILVQKHWAYRQLMVCQAGIKV